MLEEVPFSGESNALLNPLGAHAANLVGYKSISMCWARQIGWLINVKVDFEPKPLHRYSFVGFFFVFNNFIIIKTNSITEHLEEFYIRGL